MTTRTLLLLYERQQRVEALHRVAVQDDLRDVAGLEGAVGDRNETLSAALDAGHHDAPLFGESGDRPADQMSRHLDAKSQQVAPGHALADLLARMREHQQDLLHAPANRRDRREVQSLVDVGPP